MSLELLKKLAPPPARPVAAGAPHLWGAVENELGTPLPRDYKEFIETYGAGGFYDFLEVSSPFSKRSSGLVAWFKSMGATYRNDYAPIFPEPEGLLPMGGDENGDTLFWRTRGAPEDWTVVFAEEAFLEVDEFPTNVTGFLAGWLSGEIKPILTYDLAINGVKIFDRPIPPFSPSKFEDE